MNESGFWWILAAIAFYGLVHSLLASLRAKALAQRIFGAAANRFYRLFFNAVALLTFVPLLALVAGLPDQTLYSIPFPWLWLSRAVQLLGVIGLIAGVLQTGVANFIGIEQIIDPAKSEQRRMTVNGLYRWLRHPLYTCGILIIWLTPIMTWNVLAFNIAATLYMTIGALFEERKLRLEFGAAYAEYARRTPMLIPGFKCPLRGYKFKPKS